MSKLISFEIRNFRGVVSLHAEPNGQSLTLRGANGAGKSSAIDGLWWGLGGSLDGEVVHNGAEKTEVVIVFGGYQITRRKTKGGKPTLTLKSADGKINYNSPTALLSGFIGAIERQTFSHKRPAEQAAILRRLCPEIDTAKLDAEYAQLFAERTTLNRDAKMSAAQAAGVIIPEAPDEVPDDIDLVGIVEKKTAINRQITTHEKVRDEYEGNKRFYKACQFELESARQALVAAEQEFRASQGRLDQSYKAVEDLPAVPSLDSIDAEIAKTRQINAERTEQRELLHRAGAAKFQRHTLEVDARAKTEAAEDLTRRLEAIEQTKRKQLAEAKLPIPGLAVNGETVTLAQVGGPVELDALNTAARMRLDVAIAAALGHKLVAVRDASLLDDHAELINFARERGVQILSEIVAKGEPLTAEITEGE